MVSRLSRLASNKEPEEAMATVRFFVQGWRSMRGAGLECIRIIQIFHPISQSMLRARPAMSQVTQVEQMTQLEVMSVPLGRIADMS